MMQFKRLQEHAIEYGCVAAVGCMETGEIWTSTSFKSLIRAIKSSRHWGYTCQKYPWKCEGNENTSLTLCYKIATASGHYYTAWFKIENGIIIDKGFNDIDKRGKWNGTQW